MDVRAACGEQPPPILSVTQPMMGWRIYERIILNSARPGFTGLAAAVEGAKVRVAEDTAAMRSIRAS